jgi:hypothetical protein
MTKQEIDELEAHCKRSLPFECPSMVHGQTVLDLIADWKRYRAALKDLYATPGIPPIAEVVIMHALCPKE